MKHLRTVKRHRTLTMLCKHGFEPEEYTFVKDNPGSESDFYYFNHLDLVIRKFYRPRRNMFVFIIQAYNGYDRSAQDDMIKEIQSALRDNDTIANVEFIVERKGQ